VLFNVLQCVQCIAVRCSALQRVAVCCRWALHSNSWYYGVLEQDVCACVCVCLRVCVRVFTRERAGMYIAVYLYKNPQIHTQTYGHTNRMCTSCFYVHMFAAIHCNTLHHTATHCITLHHIVTRCNTLQHTATHCNTLHHTVPHCNTPCSSTPECHEWLFRAHLQRTATLP